MESIARLLPQRQNPGAIVMIMRSFNQDDLACHLARWPGHRDLSAIAA